MKNIDDTIQMAIGFEQVAIIKKTLQKDTGALEGVAEIVQRRRKEFMKTPHGKELVEHVEFLLTSQ